MGVNHLVEAHAVIHRQQINFRYIKADLREQLFTTSKAYGINPEFMEFDVNSVDGPNSLKTKLSELPKGIQFFSIFCCCLNNTEVDRH